MKKIIAFSLIITIFLQFGTTAAFAFTDTKVSPFISKNYTHDDKFLNYEIINGIDVSEWQSSVDFAKAKAAGADFVLLRAGYRGYSKGTLKKDVTFDKYASAAIAAGLDVGAYIYSQAITVKEAQEEADYILGIVKGYDLTLPIVFDFEYAEPADSRLRAANLSNKAHTNICLAFCERIEEAGYTAMVYANHSMLTNDINDEVIAQEYDIWLANYSTSPTLSGSYYDCDYSYWQYTSSGSVNGISGRVDCNFRYFKKPDAVTNLKVAKETISSTTLSWKKVKGCYGYQIYKIDPATGDYKKIGSTKGASKTTFADTSSLGMPNTYKVRAISAYKGGFSAGVFSNSINSNGVFMINISAKGTGYATFNWQVFPGADEYQVLRAETENGSYSVIAKTDSETTHYTDYTDNGFKTYYYMVKAVLRDENGELLANQYTPVQKIEKPQPTMSSAYLKKANAIEITWANVSGATGTVIYRKASGGVYKKIKTIGGTSNRYIDTGLKKGVKYAYKVCHYLTLDGKTYYSSYSNVKTAITLKATSVTVKAAKRAAKISYQKVSGASGYEIYMKASGGKYTLIKTTSKLSYTKKPLVKGKKYVFKVRAYKSVNGKKVYSSFSKVKSIRPV